VAEAESTALRARLARWPRRASAGLLHTEAVRALRRSGNDHLVGSVHRLFGGLHLIRNDEPLLDRPANSNLQICGRWTRSTLAVALTMGPDLGRVFIDDDRLGRAALPWDWTGNLRVDPE
jgi:hypothetical protein